MSTTIFDQELLDFAKQFSDTFKTLSCGDYFSDNKKYHIQYLDKIIEKYTNKHSKTGARIGYRSGIIELDKSIHENKEYTSDFVYFIILWCIVCKHERDAERSDKITIEHYLTTGRPIDNLLIGWLKLFKSVPTAQNHKRYNAMSKIFNKNGVVSIPVFDTPVVDDDDTNFAPDNSDNNNNECIQ